MGGFSWLSRSTMNKFRVTYFLATFVCLSQSQLKFGGSSSSGSKNQNSKPSDTDTRIISTGNEFVDGGILGLGAGLVGSAILGGGLNGLGGSSGNYNNPCGRRRRQAEDGKTDTRFFFGNSGGGGCNCGRKKRQAPGENEPGTRFFGLENILGGGSNNGCGCNCGNYNNQYPSNNYPSNNFQQQCQCNYNLTFRDRYDNVHGACRRADQTGRTWCYTNGGCPDAQRSQRFPNNPWSYQACNNYGK